MGSFDRSYHDLVKRYSSINEDATTTLKNIVRNVAASAPGIGPGMVQALDYAIDSIPDSIKQKARTEINNRVSKIPQIASGAAKGFASGGVPGALYGGTTAAMDALGSDSEEQAPANQTPAKQAPAKQTPVSKSKPAIRSKRPSNTVRPVPVKNPSAGGVPSQPGVSNSKFGGLLGTVSNVIGRAGDTAQNIASGQMNRGAQRRSTSLIPSVKPPPALRKRSTNVPAPKAR